MEHLKSIEHDFQSFLLSGTQDIQRHVVGTQRVPIATRLAIYGDAYRSRLIETLEANYPALLAFLGQEEFEKLGSAYVQTHDSSFASIRFYGGHLAEFLATHPGYESTPVLRELAAWEWAMTEVFDAADAACLDVSAFAQVKPADWAELRFVLHPSVRRLDLWWNAPPLWKALTGAGEKLAPCLEASALPWLLWRRELQIFFRPLTAAEAQALDAVHSGASFGEVCVELCASVSEAEAPARAASFLRAWVESGMIVRTRTHQE